MSEGTAALTPSRLHQATGVSRATIYRHWPQAVELVADLLEISAVLQQQPPPGSGTLVDQLTASVTIVDERLAAPLTLALIAAGLDYAPRSMRVAEAKTEFTNAIFAPVTVVVHAAVEQGLIGIGSWRTVADLVTVLTGPFVSSRVIGLDELDYADRRGLVEAFVLNYGLD